MGIGLVGQYACHGGPWSAATWSRHRHGVQQWQQLRVVPDLSAGEQHGQRQPVTVDGQVHLRGQSAFGPPQRLIGYRYGRNIPAVAGILVIRPSPPRGRRAPAAC